MFCLFMYYRFPVSFVFIVSLRWVDAQGRLPPAGGGVEVVFADM